jgi:hypothetical protein
MKYRNDVAWPENGWIDRYLVIKENNFELRRFPGRIGNGLERGRNGPTLHTHAERASGHE